MACICSCAAARVSSRATCFSALDALAARVGGANNALTGVRRPMAREGMDKGLLRYDRMVEAALRGVVREAIARVAGFGLPGGHSLYITFRSDFPGVDMPDWLKAQYPEAMTIVLEHQFWDLSADEETFGVTLSFKGRRQR